MLHPTRVASLALMPEQYSFTNVRKMEPLIDARIGDWLAKLEEKFVRSGEEFDFAWWAV